MMQDTPVKPTSSEVGTEQNRMEDVAKITPTKINHRKTISNSSSGDETERSQTNEKVWLYEENIKKLYNLDDNPDRQNFLDEFFHYRRTNGLYCKIPVIARKPLDVFQLYNIVQRYGGFEQTMKNRMWSQIARELELPRTMTSGAFTLKLKYIRLLYQFECYKSKKQVNKSILFNEAILNENAKEHYGMEESRRHRYASMVHSPIEDDSVVEYVRHNKEKEYREALMTQISKSDDAVYPQHERSRNVYHERHSPERYLRSPDHVRQSPSPQSEENHFVSSPLKRRNTTSEADGYESKHKRVRPSGSLSRFRVDLLETTPSHIMLRVHLNNDVYEGVLKCIEPNQFVRSWSHPYETNKRGQH